MAAGSAAVRSVAIGCPVYGQIAISVSVVARIIATEGATKPEPVIPKHAPVKKAPVVKTATVETSAVETSTMETAPETSTVGLRGSHADRRDEGYGNDRSRHQQFASHGINPFFIFPIRLLHRVIDMYGHAEPPALPTKID